MCGGCRFSLLFCRLRMNVQREEEGEEVSLDGDGAVYLSMETVDTYGNYGGGQEAESVSAWRFLFLYVYV